jgi:hypothetical protein
MKTKARHENKGATKVETLRKHTGLVLKDGTKRGHGQQNLDLEVPHPLLFVK